VKTFYLFVDASAMSGVFFIFFNCLLAELARKSSYYSVLTSVNSGGLVDWVKFLLLMAKIMVSMVITNPNPFKIFSLENFYCAKNMKCSHF
jgi:hypothetical protein